jgi:eukaryotic-like serine/threonine-protein kinase
VPLTALRDADPSRIGKYQLLARLGAGGMGVVYLGTTRASTGTANVAIKVLRPELADDPEFRARFRREVTALSRVRGICTVRVIEADLDGDRPYLVTEYVAGPTLAEWVTQHGPLSGDMLNGLAAGLAEALAAIHAAGVVHRDLKPGNVLLAADGPKVIDFGIAHTLDATSVTRTGMSVGSPGYMAPEQVKGKSGPAADIFAWALTIGYAASGQPPFGTGPADAIFYRILHDEPDFHAVPEPLQPLVTSAAAKTPEDRPTAQDLLTTLAARPGQQATAGSPGSALHAMLSRTWRVPVSSPPNVTLVRRPRSLAVRHPFLVPVAAVAIGLLGGVVVLAASSARHGGAVPLPVTPVVSCSSLGCTASPVDQGTLYSEPTWTSLAPPPVVPSPAPPPTAPMAGGGISVKPFGSCAAGCPSFVVLPTVDYSFTPGSDVPWLEQNGWAPTIIGTWSENSGQLNYIVARKFGAARGGLRVFLFDQDTYWGSDVPDGQTSADVEAFRLTSDVVDIRYHLHGTSISFADVRFQLLYDKLIRLDPMPPQQFRS